MGSQHSSFTLPFSYKRKKDDREDTLDAREQEEAIAQFPYVEFTGRDSITCLTCQGTGYIPTEQVNELVALIPHSDQRLRPQRTYLPLSLSGGGNLKLGTFRGPSEGTELEGIGDCPGSKQYVLLSVLLCLLAFGLVAFFLFPHSVLVDDDGIKVMKVTLNNHDSLVILAIKATLKIRNSNFYSVAVTSLSSQVQYMNTVVGSHVTTNTSLIPPRSERLVNFTVQAEMGGPFSYVYFFCTVPEIEVHNIVIFMRTSVKISYIGHMTESSLETHHYVDCGKNSSAV